MRASRKFLSVLLSGALVWTSFPGSSWAQIKGRVVPGKAAPSGFSSLAVSSQVEFAGALNGILGGITMPNPSAPPSIAEARQVISFLEQKISAPSATQSEIAAGKLVLASLLAPGEFVEQISEDLKLEAAPSLDRVVATFRPALTNRTVPAKVLSRLMERIPKDPNALFDGIKEDERRRTEIQELVWGNIHSMIMNQSPTIGQGFARLQPSHKGALPKEVPRETVPGLGPQGSAGSVPAPRSIRLLPRLRGLVSAAITRARAFLLRPKRAPAAAPEKPSFDENQPDQGHPVLSALGISRARLAELAKAQAEFERHIIKENPAMALSIYSLRNQERFAQTVLSLLSMTPKLRAQGVKNPLGKALAFAIRSFYWDLDPSDSRALDNWWLADIHMHFGDFISEEDLAFARTESAVLGVAVNDDPFLRRTARALIRPYPTLFKEAAGSDRELMRALRILSAGLGAELSVLWSHPFTDEEGLVGHRVPRKDKDALVFGFGEIVRQARKAKRELDAARAENRTPRRFVLLVKNIEAMEPGVRTQLQEALRVRELTHPELGTVEIPENLQLLFTIRDGANLEDDSFYDRVTTKVLPTPQGYAPPPSFALPARVNENNYLKYIKVRRRLRAPPVLVLPGAEIVLADEFKDINNGNLHDVVYLKTGMILDFETTRMLAAQAWAQGRGHAVARLEGATGVGKTYAAQGYARLRGKPFYSNPVNPHTELSDLIGGFEQNEKGVFHFNGNTLFKERLEAGGVIALSELNTLLDQNEKASLGWWLAQIAETPPDEKGYRVIRLSEVPVADGSDVPVIRIPPDALIVLDTNPQGYNVRGSLPETLRESSPVLEVPPLVSGDQNRRAQEEKRLEFYADMFLKHDWISHGEVLGRGIKDKAERSALAKKLAGAFWIVAAQHAAGEFGQSDPRVFSVRELKRMAQDLLAGDELAEAAEAHLAAGWENEKDREFVAGILSTYVAILSHEPADLALDQLISKRRPVHLRVSPEADVEGELEAIGQSREGLEITRITVTDETDRFQLEGGLVANEQGQGLTFGQGIFGRLIEKAKANPNKKVLYVFDNTHNLKPEEIVAFNEFLQEGKLHPRGRAAMELPANAHVLFISRTDSPLSWSPAERSRFVEIAHRAEAAPESSAAKALKEALSLSPELARAIDRWIEGLPRSSNFRLARFLRSAAEAIKKVMASGSGLGAALGTIEGLVQDILLSSLPSDKRKSEARKYMRPLEHYARLSRAAAEQPSSLETDLSDAKEEVLRAPDDAQREKAASRLDQLLEAGEKISRVVWKPSTAKELKDGDIVRTSAAKKTPAPAPRAFLVKDGKTLIDLRDGRELDRAEALKDDEVATASVLPMPWEEAINRARLELAFAQDAAQRDAALKKLQGLLATHPDDWIWEEKTAAELTELDIVATTEGVVVDADEINAYYTPNRVLNFFGPPGIGKTQMAAQIAATLASLGNAGPSQHTAAPGTTMSHLAAARRVLHQKIALLGLHGMNHSNHAAGNPAPIVFKPLSPQDRAKMLRNYKEFFSKAFAPSRKGKITAALNKIKGLAQRIWRRVRDSVRAAGRRILQRASSVAASDTMRGTSLPAAGRTALIQAFSSAGIASGGLSYEEVFGDLQGRDSSQFFIVNGEKTMLQISSRQESARSALPAKVKVLNLPSQEVSAAPAAEEFKPRYGAKPFYYARDAAGAIYLNFKGSWYPTRHKLLDASTSGEALPPQTFSGEIKELRAVELSDIQNPDSEAPVPLSEEAFLLETKVLEEVEQSALKAFAENLTVHFEGSPGAGKTSISRDLALLLGLPRHIFQMHGERELSDFIGAYREDRYGRIVLTAKPWRDAQGRLRFKPKLLDFLANGGVFALDEGAVGEKGRELLSWFAPIARGDKEIILQEFPGHEIRVPVHLDFHLVITSNLPEETPDRHWLKSEMAAHVHRVRVDEDESPQTLKKLFAHFLGKRIALSQQQISLMGHALSWLHHDLKSKIGKSLGKDKKERYYVSKREIRRVARLMRQALRENPREDPVYVFYRSLRMVYESMFPHADERALAHDRIKDSLVNLIFPPAALANNFSNEVRSRFPAAATADEARAATLVEELFRHGEAAMLISESGARSGDALKAAAKSLGARIEPVDAAPEHGELEILGDLLPILGPRPAASARSRNVRGKITRHLMTREEMERLEKSGEKPEPLILWIRNIDQWKEDIRTSINGLLEDGYIDLETDEGAVERFYKPAHIHFAAEIPAGSTQEVASAFYNRWVKIGVSADAPRAEPAKPSDFEKVLRLSYGLDPLEALLVHELYAGATELDREKLWANRADHRMGPSLFFALAEALAVAKTESRQWKEFLALARLSSYDPRLHPFEEPFVAVEKAVFEAYHRVTASLVKQEAMRLIGSRLSSQRTKTDISDLERFKRLFHIPESPEPELVTEDGTLGSPLKAVGGVPVSGKASVLAAAKKNKVRITSQIKRLMGLFARVDTLTAAAGPKVVGLFGETGVGKTSAAALWADLTGRRFYKYQGHAGSESTDLTIDLDQNESGEFKKRVKQFYQALRQGHAVIDIDEADVAPWVLWSLEPLLRGERRVHPIFPEEEPFDIGEDVLVVLTYNGERYSGRNKLPSRMTNSMLLARVEAPAEHEIPKIIESFYGFWDEPVEAPRAANQEAVPKQDSRPAPELTRGQKRRAGMDRLMRKGHETFDADEPAGPAAASARAPRQTPKGIFTPELYPHTRHTAYDHYDEQAGEWHLGEAGMTAVEVVNDGALARDHDLFTGRAKVRLGSDWQPLPAAGAGMKVLGLELADAGGQRLDIPVELAKDSADNYYIRASAGEAEALLQYRVAVPASYYGFPVPQGIAFHYPSDIPAEVREAIGVIDLTGGETDLRAVLHKLVGFFRDFTLEENGISSGHGSLYLDLIHSRCGVCRHRAFAFARTALGLGLKARYVESDVHAYAEVEVPGHGWLRVDLGGGGDPKNMDLSALSSERHQPRGADDFPEPENYLANNERFQKRMEEAMQEQGAQSQAAGGSGSGNANGQSRVRAELTALRQQLAQDAKLHDELSEIFASGRGDTEFIFERMLRALQDKARHVAVAVRHGLKINPVAFMLKKAKQFIRKKKETRMQTTAAAVLMDFSGSMEAFKKHLAFAVAATGNNFWRLREQAPQHFFYDLSWFTDDEKPVTVVGAGERLGQEENTKRLVTMANRAGQGGTAILPAVKEKLRDLLESREARSAKVKYLVLFTDGADNSAVLRTPRGWALTPEMEKVLEQYDQAKIDVIVIGFGDGAEQVAAFDGPGRHYLRVGKERPQDIAEAIAKVAEAKSRGMGLLPDGDLTRFLQLE